ncbi:MAG TPA: YopX family protein [Paenisporosarcina sp.]|nr:YopX family protein [Paenisporosarcina sp.]
MSRIFKFRAWDIEENEMLKDVSLNNDTWDMLNEFLENTRDEVIYMQYTGLKDKNEKEIYEDDIVSFDGNVCQIIVSEFMQIPSLELEFGLVPLYKCNNEIEVVGNVFEDAQLLG